MSNKSTTTRAAMSALTRMAFDMNKNRNIYVITNLVKFGRARIICDGHLITYSAKNLKGFDKQRLMRIFKAIQQLQKDDMGNDLYEEAIGLKSLEITEELVPDDMLDYINYLRIPEIDEVNSEEMLKPTNDDNKYVLSELLDDPNKIIKNTIKVFRKAHNILKKYPNECKLLHTYAYKYPKYTKTQGLKQKDNIVILITIELLLQKIINNKEEFYDLMNDFKRTFNPDDIKYLTQWLGIAYAVKYDVFHNLPLNTIRSYIWKTNKMVVDYFCNYTKLNPKEVVKNIPHEDMKKQLIKEVKKMESSDNLAEI